LKINFNKDYEQNKFLSQAEQENLQKIQMFFVDNS